MHRAMAVAAAVLLAGPTLSCRSVVTGDGRRGPCGAAFFGVPGSGQGLANDPPAQRPAGVSVEDANAYGTTIALMKSKLQQIGQLEQAAAVNYPAVPAQRYVSIDGLTGGLERSEQTGIDALTGLIKQAHGRGCETRPILLAGYSQGAEVVSRTVIALSAEEQKTVTIALVGNPSFEPGVPGDYPPQALFPGSRPSLRSNEHYTVPMDVRVRTIDICDPQDGICGVDPTKGNDATRADYVLHHLEAHTQGYPFGNNDYMERGAQFLWEHRTGQAS